MCTLCGRYLPAVLQDSFLDEGFILDKKIGVGQPKQIANAKVLIANTPMDTDKIKIYGARVRVDCMAKAGRVTRIPHTAIEHESCSTTDEAECCRMLRLVLLAECWGFSGRLFIVICI